MKNRYKSCIKEGNYVVILSPLVFSRKAKNPVPPVPHPQKSEFFQVLHENIVDPTVWRRKPMHISVYIKPCMWPCIISFTKQVYILILEASFWVSLSVNFCRNLIYPEDLGRKSDTYPGPCSQQVCCVLTEESRAVYHQYMEDLGYCSFVSAPKNSGLQQRSLEMIQISVGRSLCRMGVTFLKNEKLTLTNVGGGPLAHSA